MQTKSILVILPGWGGSHETWSNFIELAKNEFEVICIDLPCFGTEPCPTFAWGIDEYAEFVERKIVAIGRPIILLGHSFGGQVAAKVAINRPDLISDLILVCAAAIRPWRPVRRLFFGIIAKIGKLFFSIPFVEKRSLWAKHMLYRIVGSHDYEEAADVKKEIFKKIIRTDLSKSLSGIKLPTVVVWGEKDTYVPLRYGKEIARLIPNSKLYVIPRIGHGVHLREPKTLLKFIIEHVKNI